MTRHYPSAQSILNLWKFHVQFVHGRSAHAGLPARLYALHREEDEDRPAEVLAWGLAFPNGDAVTLWCAPSPGAVVSLSVLWKVEAYHAPRHDADVVWLTGPSSTVGPVGR
jgi:hypothetical protein